MSFGKRSESTTSHCSPPWSAVVLCRVVSCCRCYVNHLWSKPNYRINHAPSTDGLNIQGPFLPRDAMHKRGHCSRPCLSVRLSICLSVTLVDCIHTAEDIVKLLIRPGSSITVVFLTPSGSAQFRGEPLQRGTKYTGVGKFCDFRLKSPCILEMVRDRPLVAIGSHRRLIDPCWFQWPWVTLTLGPWVSRSSQMSQILRDKVTIPH